MLVSEVAPAARLADYSFLYLVVAVHRSLNAAVVIVVAADVGKSEELA